MGLFDRVTTALAHGWNAFQGEERSRTRFDDEAEYFERRPSAGRGSFIVDRTTLASIYTRISIDCAAVKFYHCDTDDQGRFKNERKSGLNDCLQVSANIDQPARAFLQDEVLTLLEEGYIATVPVDTTLDPEVGGSWDIQSMRVGIIKAFKPSRVQVELFNEKLGKRQTLWLEKKNTAITYNPLYNVMNEPNSTYKRLMRKLAQLDAVDEMQAGGKLDLIIQLPYVVASEKRKAEAKKRAKDIEVQLKGNQYGVAYTDGTEKITQLNRPVENTLLKEVEWLERKLYGELGLTVEIMNGTADEAAMINYYNRTVEPICDALREEKHRKFLTKTARTQGQAIMFFRNIWSYVPLKDMAEIADKMVRNEVLTSNEIRQGIGYKPSTDPKADQLINSNMPTKDTLPAGRTQADTQSPTDRDATVTPEPEGAGQNGST